ncbi:MAG: nucleotide sugar dehydrogenase [Pseudomonadota bacterium]
MGTVAVVGLGYVGLPLATALGTRSKTIGFDRDADKILGLKKGLDSTGEVDHERIQQAVYLEFTDSPAKLSEASVIIVAVPTPIDAAKRPDLGPLIGAAQTVGKHLSPGATVVFESTVYPGCTEEVCVPILEQASGYSWSGRHTDFESSGGDTKSQFNVGYSPERINPGDKQHRLENIVKIVAGDSKSTTHELCVLYETVIEAGVFAAKSIRVAEAAKVIENTQRDLNIALMNELAMIFEHLELDTLDVLEAAGTKWNFLPFKPGLVGGHCIGVDPYYLTYKAESVGYHPQVVLAGRRINDGMGKFIAEQTVKQLARRGIAITGSQVNVLGLTFKEDCADLRNSRVPDIVRELSEYGCEVSVHDPLADSNAAVEEFDLNLVRWEDLPPCRALVLAVPHRDYAEMDLDKLTKSLSKGSILIDVKGLVDQESCETRGFLVWRL